ncbi:TPA: hypothetical protein DF272_05750 [Candidatus Falkowbacteria bacterium]|nr:hypothetical protein [Candidatus Falkowbacteria bacterium]
MLNAPFVPTHKVDLQRIGDMVEHYDIKRLVDLGSGNGRIIGYLAKRFPERNFAGIEIAPLLFSLTKIRFWRMKKIKIILGSVFNHGWRDYDAIFVFWMPKAFEKKIEKIKQRLIQGQVVISYAFPIPGLSDHLVEKNVEVKQLPIYVYKI